MPYSYLPRRSWSQLISIYFLCKVNNKKDEIISERGSLSMRGIQVSLIILYTKNLRAFPELTLKTVLVL